MQRKLLLIIFNKGLIPDVAAGTSLRTYLPYNHPCTTPDILKEKELTLLEQNFHASRIGDLKLTTNIRADPMVTVEDYNSTIASFGVIIDPQITLIILIL